MKWNRERTVRWGFTGLVALCVLLAVFQVKAAFEKKVADVQEITDALVKLKAKYGLVVQEKESQRDLMKRIRDQNHGLADQLDKANARIQGLITLTVTYKKEIKRLKMGAADVEELDPGGPDRIAFHRDFDLATLDGWFTADNIENPIESEFTLTPKPQSHQVVDTDQGTVAVPDNDATITVQSSAVKRPWLDGLGIMTGGDIGPNGGSIMAGVDWRGWALYIRHQDGRKYYGFMRRWTWGGQ